MPMRLHDFTPSWVVHIHIREILLMENAWYKLLLPYTYEANRLIIQGWKKEKSDMVQVLFHWSCDVWRLDKPKLWP
jgi:hypothetical protein